MTNLDRKLADSSDAHFYRVGSFALYSHRSCEQARAHFGLSSREVEVLLHVAGGFTKQEIANKMGVSPATADTFRRRAYTKLGVRSGAAAVTILSAYLSGTRVEVRDFEDAA
nr:helix-turn-helix transcriptional regulator [Hyphomonas sp. Mor2]